MGHLLPGTLDARNNSSLFVTLLCVCISFVHRVLAPSLTVSLSLSPSLSLFVCLSLIDLLAVSGNVILPSRQRQCLSSLTPLLLIRLSPSFPLCFLSPSPSSFPWSKRSTTSVSLSFSHSFLLCLSPDQWQ